LLARRVGTPTQSRPALKVAFFMTTLCGATAQRAFILVPQNSTVARPTARAPPEQGWRLVDSWVDGWVKAWQIRVVRYFWFGSGGPDRSLNH
jgi:hypothetical protein